MAGTIAADILTHSTAGSLGTDFVVNGSAKSWLNLTGSGTPTINGTLNVSSITDHGTGQYTENFTSNYSSANDQSFSGGANVTSVYAQVAHASVTTTTSTHKFFVLNASGSTFYDATPAWIQGHGDLA